MIPANSDEALDMLESAMGFLAGVDPTSLPDAKLARSLRVLERTDAVEAAVRGRLLEAFDAQDAHVADGQRTSRTWLVHVTRVTKGQAAEHKAIQALARRHQPLLTALAEGHVITRSVALQLARWTRAIPEEYRDEAEEILVAAARAGAGLRSLAAICAEIRARTADPDNDNDNDQHLDRGLSLDTTFDGAGVIHGDLTPQCAAMVQAVLDALSAPEGGGDLRTRPQRYHDALAEAMRRLGFCIWWTHGQHTGRPGGNPTQGGVYVRLSETYDAAESVPTQIERGTAKQPRSGPKRWSCGRTGSIPDPATVVSWGLAVGASQGGVVAGSVGCGVLCRARARSGASDWWPPTQVPFAGRHWRFPCAPR